MLTVEFVGAAFCVALACTAIVAWLARPSGTKDVVAHGAAFKIFQRRYLAGALLAMAADWLQGPYVYALYESYGITHEQNATLFVFGFGSSAVFGTFVGSLADRFGRRRLVFVYCGTYIAACVTKHFRVFEVLLFGRVLAGISTSLLFSVFDSWLVCEHNSRGFLPSAVGETFSMFFFGNSLVAIAAGTVAQWGADAMPLTESGLGNNLMYGGYTAPFDIAAVALVVCFVVVGWFWTENYGSAGDAKTSGASFGGLVLQVMQTPKLLCCGLASACFEGSMYIFVFFWTPSVTEKDAEKPPYGIIFASFMVCCMLGSKLYALFAKTIGPEKMLPGLLGAACMCHGAVLLSKNTWVTYLSFLAFEACVGMYFPMMGTLKGCVVPEEARATIYNIYRIPLNAIVVSVLVLKLTPSVGFCVTTGMLGVGAVVGMQLDGHMRADAARDCDVLDDVEVGQVAAKGR
mmetsp:Transcript_96046/g.220189  ORF Transcript_96046/g.220189 Transcript_96046/m.220189 type:complete len:460 (+) Transcript_96046:73-1452(+)